MSNRRFVAGLWLILAFSLAGCATLKDLVSSAEAERRGAANADAPPRDNLLEYYNWLASAPPQDFQQEHDVALTHLQQKVTPRSKLVFALLLSVPNTPYANTKRARTLVEDYLRTTIDPADADLGLARLLSGLLKQNARTQRQKAWTRRALKKEQERCGSLDSQVSHLEIQIEQLKALEQDMTAKEDAVNVPPAAASPHGKADDTTGR